MTTHRSLDVVNTELKQLNRRHRELLQERRRLLAERPQPNQSETSKYWADPIFTIIQAYPGISREKLVIILEAKGDEITYQVLTNCLTTLRRRGWIVNHGSRKRPKWYAKPKQGE